MSESETWDFVESAHTGIFATLRSRGARAITPLWFVVVERTVCLRTQRASAKAKHIEADPWVSFLVDSGHAWGELKAVVLYSTVEILTEADAITRVDEEFARKYDGFPMPSGTPEKTRQHYAAERVHLRMVPSRRASTWDNAKLLR